MGPRTAEAVREFQSREGIVATGQLDAETRARLMGSRADSSAPSASPATSTTSNSNPNTSDNNTKAKK
jgi:peptidoglycan hydrolase-like protein with peptidoglycan-binding domain